MPFLCHVMIERCNVLIDRTDETANLSSVNIAITHDIEDQQYSGKYQMLLAKYSIFKIDIQ